MRATSSRARARSRREGTMRVMAAAVMAASALAAAIIPADKAARAAVRQLRRGAPARHPWGLTRVPPQYELWHRGPAKLPDFIRYLNSWKADDAHQPGKQEIYSNTGFFLLALALQRGFNTPIAKLMEARVLAPLGMSSTVWPVPSANGRGQLAPELPRRAVQGYNADAAPVGG